MSRTRDRANTKGVKTQRLAYRAWRVASGMRDHDAERQVQLAGQKKQKGQKPR